MKQVHIDHSNVCDSSDEVRSLGGENRQYNTDRNCDYVVTVGDAHRVRTGDPYGSDHE